MQPFPRLAPVLALALALVGVAALPGCGGPALPPIVYTPMTDADELAFENGADFVDDPTLLEGNWLEEWEQSIAERCDRADAVAVITIMHLQTSTDLERRESYRLVGHVDLTRFGTVASELSLIVREGEDGYQSIRGAEGRLLNQQFIAFVRWVEGDNGPVPRWHLSPATERVSRRVNTLLESRRPDEDRRRVIVHDRRDGRSSDDDDGEAGD